MGEEKGSMRDRHWDRLADRDRADGDEPAPSGSLGPSGDTLDREQGEGGMIEPDPPEDLG
jgi:hypothetical protein